MKTMSNLTVITGCMKAGKTTHLIRTVTGLHKPYLAFYPSIDTRYGGGIVSHDALKITAIAIDPDKPFDILRHANISLAKIIAIDEAQFFKVHEFLTAVDMLLKEGKDLYIAGLETDFLARPFGAMPQLQELACKRGSLIRLFARCDICGGVANRTQRLVNDKPAKADDPLIVVGGADTYQARCENCYEIGA